MKKYEKCFNCDSEFIIKWPEGNENLYGVPEFCPFCGIDRSTEESLNYEEEEEAEYEE